MSSPRHVRTETECAVALRALLLGSLLCGVATRLVAQQPAPTPAPPRPPPASTSDNSAVRTGSSWIGAGLALGVLNLPKVGVGAELLSELRTRALWPIELGFVYWFENDAELGLADTDLMVDPWLLVPFPAGGSSLRVRAVQLSAATCPFERHMDADSLLLCTGLRGGVLRAAGEGLVAARTSIRPTLELELYARYHFRLGGKLGVSYSAGLFVAFIRERFGYLDREGEFKEAFRSAPLGARLDLALTYGF